MSRVCTLQLLKEYLEASGGIGSVLGLNNLQQSFTSAAHVPCTQLLKEYLEASGGIDSVAALNASKGVKKHRNVDRRASKSRRLR